MLSMLYIISVLVDFTVSETELDGHTKLTKFWPAEGLLTTFSVGLKRVPELQYLSGDAVLALGFYF